ncbi:MAG: hypothetical protein FWD23_00395 [Oscillospiraceae bacterium]|nr:hypothetical protein [Oscillospiraceae bacterium]
MKKIGIFLVFALLVTTLAAFIPVSAIPPTYNFTMPKLVIPVELGKVNPADAWIDSASFVLDANNEVMKEFGRWQGAEDNRMYGPDELSVTYRLKWDESYLYIREERFDKEYYFTYDHAREPWIGDGTLFFIAYDDGDPKFEKSYQPFWANKDVNGETKVALRYWRDDVYSMYDDPEAIGNWKYAGTNEGDVYITELAVPWSDLKAYTPSLPAIAEGLKLRFTPVVPNVSSEDLFGEDWNQMNMHDRFGRDDADTDEASNPGELPANWAGLILGPATYAPPAEPEPEPEPVPEPAAPAPAPEPAAPAPTPAAPVTGDAMAALLLGVIFAAGALFAARRLIKIK